MLVLMITALALGAQSTTIEDSPPILPGSYSLICKAQQTVGFNWKAGEWKGVQITNAQRIIVASSANKCLEQFDETVGGSPGFYYKNVCLNEREIGEQYFPYSSSKCSEFYSKRDASWDRLIQCDSPNLTVRIKPDGRYTLSHIDEELSDKPNNDYKDSQYVEVGRCSLVLP